jgi:hypothetical protein
MEAGHQVSMSLVTIRERMSKGSNKTESKGEAKGKLSKGKGSGKGSSAKKPQGKSQAHPKGYQAVELNRNLMRRQGRAARRVVGNR